MEDELFKKYKVNYNKLLEYGFKLEDDKYLYSTNILDNSFRVDITITDKVVGKVIDLEFNDEYNNFRMSEIGSFAGKVRNEYENILLDIRNKCFIKEYFIFSQSNRITNYIIDKYNDEPEFLWEKLDGCGVFRNKNSNKWYSIIMNVDKSKITNGNGEIEVMNLKLDRNQIENLLNEKGYYKAYHMNKKDWISIILDDTLSDKIICNLIDESYNNVNEKEYWIVPANPKYYDIVNCFNDKDEIIWKQSTDVHINDIVYI